MQTARDTYNQLEYAKKKGREEGLQQGLQQGHEQGREERSREIVIKMLRNGLSIQTICACTGLSAEEISKLQNEVQQ